mmetsp:Transcript_37936/g.113335  ORF Transcript_37936/g.113335 Transcript_37936/m.113335 type:complete len:92 (+) Transcript_37936:164-439(+)
MPFERVRRLDCGIPASNVMNPDLFHPSLLSVDNGGGGGLLRVPLPTGLFWSNLILRCATAVHGFFYPITAHPHSYDWNREGLKVPHHRAPC